MPKNYRKDFSQTRIIITKIHTHRSRNPFVQQAGFSYYKNDITLKAVACNSPGSQITYYSRFLGGSTNVRQVVERSRFRTKCAGDMIMANRGFTV